MSSANTIRVLKRLRKRFRALSTRREKQSGRALMTYDQDRLWGERNGYRDAADIIDRQIRLLSDPPQEVQPS